MAVVLVTGCGSGLGPLVALGFARKGDRVYATMRGTHRRETLIEAAGAEGLHVEVLELDVTDDASVQRAVAHVLNAEGQIDVLVNNAGVLHLGPVELLPDELLRETFETNFYGPLRLLRAVLPSMRSQRSGVVVNVSSVAGRVAGAPIHWSYMASKHAVSVLSDGLAFELEPFGIRVISIEPGFFRTGIVAKTSRPVDPDSPYRELEEAMAQFMENGVAGGGDAEAVAQAILDAVDDDGPVHVLVGDEAHAFVHQDRTLSEQEMTAFFKELIGMKTEVPGAGTV